VARLVFPTNVSIFALHEIFFFHIELFYVIPVLPSVLWQ